MPNLEPIPTQQHPDGQQPNGGKLMIRLPPMDGDKNVRCTFCPLEHHQPIVNLIEAYLCAHPLIPVYSAPTVEVVWEWAVKQMYQYCYTHDLQEAWAYLWENWDHPGQWEFGFRTGMENPAVFGPRVLRVQVQFRKLIPMAIPYPYRWCHGYWRVFWPKFSLEKHL